MASPGVSAHSKSLRAGNAHFHGLARDKCNTSWQTAIGNKLLPGARGDIGVCSEERQHQGGCQGSCINVSHAKPRLYDSLDLLHNNT